MTQVKQRETFVVRCWLLTDGEQRLEIEHVTSGERHRCASLPAAEAWIFARFHAPGRTGPGIAAARLNGVRNPDAE